MQTHRTHCVPHPNQFKPVRKKLPMHPLSIHWLDCEPQAFVEALLEPVLEMPGGRLNITIKPNPDQDASNREHYAINVTPDGTHLTATTVSGVIYGASTLVQLYQNKALSNLERIEDGPRYSWRGLLIDPARHFLCVSLLERIIDGMARLKMNVLHLHLTDDQAFRIECLSYPKLQSSQHYTQTQLKHLVAYARTRAVRIIPEIDVPGHVTSWLHAYPEWGYQSVSETQRFGVHKACLNPADEQVYVALRAIFTEVTDIFSDDCVHIGGDEVHPAWWQEDPAVQALMRDAGLADLRAVQNYFTTRIVLMLKEMGKTAIGWDEVLHEDMPQMVVQNWRGMTTRDRIGGHRLPCIVSAPFYLDLGYPADMHYAYDLQAPQADAVALEDAHQKDPRLAHVKDGIAWTLQWRREAIEIEETTDVLGGEACLWSEIVDEATLETRLWSRLPAVAERLWSDQAHPDFGNRLDALLQSPPYHLEARQRTALAKLGLTAEQTTIALLLEPVKWYARLLGRDALEARISGHEMPQARPYQVHTPLNRVVDMISPESRSATALKRGADADWLLLADTLRRQDTSQWPDDTRPVIEAFKAFADQIHNGDRAAAQALYVPHGEYMIAAIHAWLNRA